MRKLPVYLLLDVSGSMSGEPIESVKIGMQTLLSTLRQDPYALETAHLSVITFESQAKQIVPLTELTAFQIPNLKAGGGTALGAALNLLADRINAEVSKTTAEKRGDWKPLVFIMTDGESQDSVHAGVEKLRQAKTGMIVACAAGHNADKATLKQITENVVELDTADASTIKSFFKWVSASIAVSSQKIDQDRQNVSSIGDLPPPPPEVNIVI